eukprot:gene3388-biopygen6696
MDAERGPILLQHGQRRRDHLCGPNEHAIIQIELDKAESLWPEASPQPLKHGLDDQREKELPKRLPLLDTLLRAQGRKRPQRQVRGVPIAPGING